MRKHFPEDEDLKLFSGRYNTPTFNTISVHPVISPTQIQSPQGFVLPSVEMPDAVNSPIQKVIDSIATHSPKRPFPDDFEDVGPRKVARGESPLKGAAGRRMNQQQQQRQINPPAGMPAFPVPPPLPSQITYLLSILPRASTYVDARLDATKMVELIRDIHLPPPSAVAGQHPPPTPVPGSGWPPYPQHPPAQMPPQGFIPPPGAAQAPYGGSE
jgi:cleavage stimulation factor subunit 3